MGLISPNNGNKMSGGSLNTKNPS